MHLFGDSYYGPCKVTVTIEDWPCIQQPNPAKAEKHSCTYSTELRFGLWSIIEWQDHENTELTAKKVVNTTQIFTTSLVRSQTIKQLKRNMLYSRDAAHSPDSGASADCNRLQFRFGGMLFTAFWLDKVYLTSYLKWKIATK